MAQATVQLRQLSPDVLPGQASLVRSWKRWEQGTIPSRSYRRLLAGLLDSSTDEPVGVDMSGLWHAAWQSWHDGHHVVGIQQVRCEQVGPHIAWSALDRGHPPGAGQAEAFRREDGGYVWQGELRLWDGELLIGWYAADDGSVRSKGAVHLALHPHGLVWSGRWVGLSYDGVSETGLGAMSRTEQDVARAIETLIARER